MCFKKKNIQSKWNFTLLSWIAEYVFQSIAKHKSLMLIGLKDTKLLVLLIFFLWVHFWTESEHTEPPYSPHLAVWFFHYPFHFMPEAQAYVETEAPVDLEGDFGGLCDWKEREKEEKKVREMWSVVLLTQRKVGRNVGLLANWQSKAIPSLS